MIGRRGSADPSGPAPSRNRQSGIGTIQAQFRAAARKLFGFFEMPKPKQRRRGEGAVRSFPETMKILCRRCMHAAVWHRSPDGDLSVWHAIWEYNEYSGLDFDCNYGYTEGPSSSHHPAP